MAIPRKAVQVTAAEYNAHMINRVGDTHPTYRQKGKTDTFALTYRGTAYTLFKNSLENRSMEDAETIYENYVTNYKVSIAWTDKHLNAARNSGFVTGCFGLRLRTPLLAKSLELGNSVNTRMCAAEERSAGNMLGQSYCMLTMRAFNEFLERVHKSKYRYTIKTSCTIYDAIYLYVPRNPEALAWVNKHLIECMEWQELEELKHDTVKLQAELEVFYPDWSTPKAVANNITEEELTPSRK